MRSTLSLYGENQSSSGCVSTTSPIYCFNSVSVVQMKVAYTPQITFRPPWSTNICVLLWPTWMCSCWLHTQMNGTQTNYWSGFYKQVSLKWLRTAAYCREASASLTVSAPLRRIHFYSCGTDSQQKAAHATWRRTKPNYEVKSEICAEGYWFKERKMISCELQTTPTTLQGVAFEQSLPQSGASVSIRKPRPSSPQTFKIV